ncbi:hypothetical protein QQY66_00095 [Streptomyces sp. DG2A-72]|uniref:hypothetical protein n=1 Tax=Streptomyces sp. DG2A-72 TaxID=3051386 RepID=UPI00265C3BDF|nr:hypothetical protein [Streptomyces sp. DG2A-72]MDO0930197.1 hypothetical protein [Streptomyces sp. DG2A-72]
MPDDQPVRLHCFAHSAGGVSVFDGWAERAGPGVEVRALCLPGGERRRSEPRVTTHEALLADVLPSSPTRARAPTSCTGTVWAPWSPSP